MSGDAGNDARGRETAHLYTDGGTGKLVLRRFKLQFSGPGGELEKVHERGTLLVGAHPDNDVVVDDRAVSRYHLSLGIVDGGIQVKDRGSKNGTFVNGGKVAEALCKQGDRITLGSTTISIGVADEAMDVKPAAMQRFGALIGVSDAMRTLFAMLEKVARSDATVLVEGETGTGKELVARAIHDASPRKGGPFVVVDCGAVAPELVESELFGHEKGSFTGAIASRTGAFEEADGGTIFLDEIGELPVELQPKLLRALEAREVKRVGDNKPRKVDVRVVAATHRDLGAMAASEAPGFRPDLYYRLAVVKLRVPPLRERREDIPVLVDHFLKQLGREPVAVSPSLRDRLAQHGWPGNVRELRNAVERAAALSGADEAAVLSQPALRPHALSDAAQRWRGLAFKDAKGQIVEAFEREYLADLLARHAGNISAAAREAKIDRNYIHRLVKKYDLDVPR